MPERPSLNEFQRTPIVVIAVALLLPMWTSAQEPDLPAGDVELPQEARRSFESLDMNGDGRVSRGEWKKQIRDDFRRLDVNRDGVLSASDFGEQAPGLPATSGTATGDANGDGEVTPDEFSDAIEKEVLELLDQDGDGDVLKAEARRGEESHKKERARKKKAHREGGWTTRSEIAAIQTRAGETPVYPSGLCDVTLYASYTWAWLPWWSGRMPCDGTGGRVHPDPMQGTCPAGLSWYGYPGTCTVYSEPLWQYFSVSIETGTDASDQPISLRILGEQDWSEAIALDNVGVEDFEVGATDTFAFSAPNLGKTQRIRLETGPDSWQVKRVELHQYSDPEHRFENGPLANPLNTAAISIPASRTQDLPPPAPGADWIAYPDEAINCASWGCLDSGPGCTQDVRGQCSFPADQASALCAVHPACVAITCNSGRKDCQARQVTNRSAWNGFTSHMSPSAAQAPPQSAGPQPTTGQDTVIWDLFAGTYTIEPAGQPAGSDKSVSWYRDGNDDSFVAMEPKAISESQQWTISEVQEPTSQLLTKSGTSSLPSRRYIIQQKSNGYFVDALQLAYQRNGGYEVVLKPIASNSDSQRWFIEHSGGDDMYTIEQASTRRFVQAHEGGAAVVTRPAASTYAQRWIIKPAIPIHHIDLRTKEEDRQEGGIPTLHRELHAKWIGIGGTGPTALPEPAFVLDASKLDLSDGQTMGQWGVVGVGHLMDPPSPPVFRFDRTPNGKPAVEFGGHAQLGWLTGLPASATGDLIVAAVLKREKSHARGEPAGGRVRSIVDGAGGSPAMLRIHPSNGYELNGGGEALATGTGPNGWDIVIADSRTNRLYVNGRKVASGGGASAYTSMQPLGILNRPGTLGAFRGLLAELRIYTSRPAMGWDPAPSGAWHELARRFAPQLRFDRGASEYGYPMSAQKFFENNDKLFATPEYPVLVIGGLKDEVMDLMDPYGNSVTTDSGEFYFQQNQKLGADNPIYYQMMFLPSGQLRIMYWIFYGYQHACNKSGIGDDTGEHHADWERVMVTLKEDRSDIAAVTYWQHSGWYTRIAGPRDAPCTPYGIGRCEGSDGFDRVEGTHPVVYVGKIAHGSYHTSLSWGVGDWTSVGLACEYWSDLRNPESPADYLDTWRHDLIDMASDAEPWMAVDRSEDTFRWGGSFSGIGQRPSKTGPREMKGLKACKGAALYAGLSGDGNGCFKSECLSGDDQLAGECFRECKKGYTNVGLTCNKGVLPWEWKIYGRAHIGNYDYDYVVPVDDVGLSRRRSSATEWSVP